MDPKLRARMVLHGVIVIGLGLAAGVPYASAIASGEGEPVRAWHMAHLEGVLNGLLVLALAGAGGFLVLRPREQRTLALCAIGMAYGNVVASILGAATGNRGLAPGGSAINTAVYLLFVAAVVGIVVALALAGMGAARAARTGDRPTA
ncbi:MAG TPA: hypothetical protein DEP35_11585 [Deltaproteobacteria bacterium]|jgi:hypothetical protein|nr:hypothetical protein [Deltaproteobacteria bacterium]